MTGDDVASAVRAMTKVLSPHSADDWTQRAGSLEWTCESTAAHVAHDLTAYAIQVARSGQDRYLPIDLTIRPHADPSDLLEVVAGCGDLLSAVLSAAHPDRMAWHWGLATPASFAALGVNEILVHTFDITKGLGVSWTPPQSLADAVIAHLFPNAPGGDPALALLWCTGRIDLPDRPAPNEWFPGTSRA
jgi:hypothetical protein